MSKEFTFSGLSDLELVEMLSQLKQASFPEDAEFAQAVSTEIAKRKQRNDALACCLLLDTLIVREVMRWEIVDWQDGADGGCELRDKQGNIVGSWSWGQKPRWRWSPSTDLDATYLMEERLRQLGVHCKYATELRRHFGEMAEPEWEMIHAAAETRCHIALGVMGVSILSEENSG